MTAANKALGKLRCSLQALKSACDGTEDAEQASAVAILEKKIAELEAKRQQLIPAEVRLKAHYKTTQALLLKRGYILEAASKAVEDVAVKSQALTDSIALYLDATTALAAVEKEVEGAKEAGQAEASRILNHQASRLAEKKNAMNALSAKIAELTNSGAPMASYVDKFSELSVLASEVDALQQMPKRIEGDGPDDLDASVAAGKLHDSAVRLLSEACGLQKSAAALSWKHAQDKRRQALESLPLFTADAENPQVQCDFDGEAHAGRVDLSGTDFVLIVLGMKVHCGGQIGEIKAITLAQEVQAPAADTPVCSDAMSVDTGTKRLAEGTAEVTATAAKRQVQESVPAKAAPPTVHLLRAIGGLVDAAATAAAEESGRGSAGDGTAADGQAGSAEGRVPGAQRADLAVSIGDFEGSAAYAGYLQRITAAKSAEEVDALTKEVKEAREAAKVRQIPLPSTPEGGPAGGNTAVLASVPTTPILLPKTPPASTMPRASSLDTPRCTGARAREGYGPYGDATGRGATDRSSEALEAAATEADVRATLLAASGGRASAEVIQVGDDEMGEAQATGAPGEELAKARTAQVAASVAARGAAEAVGAGASRARERSPRGTAATEGGTGNQAEAAPDAEEEVVGMTQAVAVASEAAAGALKASRIATVTAAAADAAVEANPASAESHAAVALASAAMTSAEAAVERAKVVQGLVADAKAALEVAGVSKPCAGF